MSDVFQRIATVHREAVIKAEKTRNERKKKLTRRQAYFSATGLSEMWADVANIIIPNPVPDVLEGFTVPMSALLIDIDEDNLQKTGLVFYGKNDTRHVWAVDDFNDDDKPPELRLISYRVNTGKTCFSVTVEHADGVNRFVTSFVKWLAKYITPTTLLDMNVPIEISNVPQRARKILQTAGADE